MNVDDAIGASVDALAGRPADLLPLYFVGAGAVQVARTSVLAAAAVAYLLLVADGRVAGFRDAVGGRTIRPDAREPVEVVEGLSVEEVVELARTHLLDPEAAAVLALGVLGFLVLQVAATAVVNAGKLHAVRVCLAGERGAVRAGAAGLREDGPTMVGVAALRVVAVVALLAAVQGAAAVAGPVVGVLAALAAVVPLVVVYLAFMFAPQAVVVDGAGPGGAVRASLRFVADRPATVLVYALVAATVAAVVVVAAAVFAALSVSQLTAPVVWFLALPLLDLVKTGIYLDDDAPTGDGAGASTGLEGWNVAGEDAAADGDAGETDEEGTADDGGAWTVASAGDRDGPAGDRDGSVRDGRRAAVADGGPDVEPRDEGADWQDDPGAVARLRGALRRGLAELGSFVREAPLLVAISFALFAVGGVAGWRVTAPFEFAVVRTEPVAETFGSMPVDVFVALAVNNWSVAVTQSFSGLAAGLPTVASLLFNGVVVGAVAGIGYDPVLLTALVAPHGVIEFPALAVSGALGLSLGREGWLFARGRRSPEAMAAVLRRAFDVLVGLAPVFVVAAFVEAFLTPAIASLVAA